MAKISKTRLVKDRLALVRQRLVDLKEEYEDLKEQANKLAVALEVLESLSSDDDDDDNPDEGPGRGKSVVQRVVECFSDDAVLTSGDVIAKLNENGEVNQGTVGATLSRLVKSGVLEKASQSEYRLAKKEEAVGAGNTDGLDLV